MSIAEKLFEEMKETPHHTIRVSSTIMVKEFYESDCECSYDYEYSFIFHKGKLIKVEITDRIGLGNFISD